jgi:Tfp pilus assembly protein PilV
MPTPFGAQQAKVDMPTFFLTLLAAPRRRRQRLPVDSARASTTPVLHRHGPARLDARAEDGLLLLEVLISALIVGLIVVGTFTGIDVAQSTSISERDHNEAILLSSESQESLRSAPASTFDSSTGVWEHAYTKSINGETYSVTQKASFLNSGGEATACSATNTTRQETNSLRLTSIVSWPQQEAQERAHGTDPPVTVSSLTTPPAASALEVDVGNYPTPTAGVAGVPVTIKYISSGTSTEESLSGTTASPGCVVFSAVPASSAKVEIGEKAGYVDPSGSSKWPTKEATIAPNHTTHYPVTLNEGGAITAELRYLGAATWKHKRNGTGTEITENVTGDTIVARNQLMESSPNFELGSAKAGTWSSGIYRPVFGTTTTASSTTPNETWNTSITTPIETAGTKYPHGNLFPFPAPGAWDVYAGACTANNPHTLNAAISESTVDVTGATTQAVTVPVPYMLLNVYTGTKVTPGSFQEATAYPVTITNTACKSLTPDNETAINEPEETQFQTVSNSTNSTTWPEYGGHLEHPFLPFGEGELCLAYNTTGTSAKHDTFTTTYDLTAEGQYTRNIYLSEALTYSSSRGAINTAKYTESVSKPPSGTETAEVQIEATAGTVACP